MRACKRARVPFTADYAYSQATGGVAVDVVAGLVGPSWAPFPL
jgi:hypothetical protein